MFQVKGLVATNQKGQYTKAFRMLMNFIGEQMKLGKKITFNLRRTRWEDEVIDCKIED